MNIARSGAFGLVVCFSLVACAGQQPTPVNGPNPGVPAGLVRARGGETVYLIEHYVRADRREQFEQFVNSVLWPALQQTAAANPARQQVLRQTRMLQPTGPNVDGSYTYTFVLDPVVPGESYNILDILREVHPEGEAEQQYAQFTETWAREFTSRPFVQSESPPAPGT